MSRADLDAQRALFEAWYSSEHSSANFQRYADGVYCFAKVDFAWNIWQAALAAQAPVQGNDVPWQWAPGPDDFKAWCSSYFGPDSDETYLAEAVFNLPTMAQKFKWRVAPVQGEPVAWITYETKDGKQKLEIGSVSSNPEYCKVHKNWIWIPLYASAIDAARKAVT